MPLLREIARFFETLGQGWEPALAIDYDVPEDKIYDCDMEILSKCGCAVFEVTLDAGHLMEIERGRRLGMKIYGFYQARKPGAPPPDKITKMLTTSGIPLFPYASWPELQNRLSRIFPAIETAKLSELARRKST